jgi:hypothetical protein
MTVLRFPQTSSTTPISPPGSSGSKLKPSCKRLAKASYSRSHAAMPEWRSWVTAMERYLCRIPPGEASLVVDELRDTLNQLQRRHRRKGRALNEEAEGNSTSR